MFLPSGRVHALGAGSVLFEIQQNSDTTYRVFDWNRVGLDGKPRELHVPQSLASIDFADFEPPLITSRFSRNPAIAVRFLVDEPQFMVNACQVRRGQRYYLTLQTPQIIGLLKGQLRVGQGDTAVTLRAGQFCLIPAAVGRVGIGAEKPCEFIQAEPR
jgi:mannose-6-phosphate isomerase